MNKKLEKGLLEQINLKIIKENKKLKQIEISQIEEEKVNELIRNLEEKKVPLHYIYANKITIEYYTSNCVRFNNLKKLKEYLKNENVWIKNISAEINLKIAYKMNIYRDINLSYKILS